MSSIRRAALFAAALCGSLSQAAPTPKGSHLQSRSSSYWLADISHAGDQVWGNPSSDYVVFRDVTQYGATGDGTTDDTAAIMSAMTQGNRCGGNTITCDSSTITPAILYFPPGTYVVSTPINMYYYTQMIGDPNDLPVLQAAPDFTGMAVIDADPYYKGQNWYTNQNNFFRQVRNFVIDLTQQSGTAATGIHWQVAQATSLQNIEFRMTEDPDTEQQGIFMDNGSGGFFSDLTFTGGKYGAFLGNQQFTTRNLTFVNCQTAIYMNWNWGWTIQGINVQGGTVAVDMSAQPTNQSVGSVILADSNISGTQYGVRFSYQNDSSNVPAYGGTLILDNVDMSGVVQGSVVDYQNSTILPPGQITAWASGHGYLNSATGVRQENEITAPTKASSLLAPNGYIFSRSKPQYETSPVTSFLSAMSNGLAGDGQTDDTSAMQSFLDKASSSNLIAYFEHGAYLVSDTIRVPGNVKIVGEIWPLIVANGNSSTFNDASNPQPVFQIGERNSSSEDGAFEISDMIFETLGPAPGAIMIEWNLKSPQGASGWWDTHVRIGGSANTELEVAQCAKDPQNPNQNHNSCEGVFLMFHATSEASGVYLENSWLWVADHELDQGAPMQLSIYSGRGMLIQSKGPVWLWGTASEHSILYNYQFDGAQALFSGFMQSETPYFQPDPLAPAPFQFNHAYDDPLFTVCTSDAASADSSFCKESWGLRIWRSDNVLIYGTGLYSFFQNYEQSCVAQQNCQDNMIHIQNSHVDMYAVTTKAAVHMLIDDGVGSVLDADNRDVFGATMAFYFTDH